MSVTIATNPQQATWWQRLTGTEPKTVITETSRTEVTSVPGSSFDFKTALRNGGIGAAVAGVLGGVSLLGKVALPIIGKVASLGGLARIAGIGGALGVATAALPWVMDKAKGNPTAKAALTGAAIGAAAGAVMPFVPVWLGAAVGAGVGLLVDHRRRNPGIEYAQYNGYTAYPGYVAVGGTGVGSTGMVPVIPTGYAGGYGASMVNPYSYGYGSPVATMPYATSPYGYGSSMMSLPAQATQLQGAVAQPTVATQPVAVAQPSAVAQPVVRTGSATIGTVAAGTKAPAAATKKPATATKAKFPKAKTWIDKQGNVRQVGTGKIVKKAASGSGTSGSVTAGTSIPNSAPVFGVAPVSSAAAAAAAAATPAASSTNLAAYLSGLSGLSGLQSGALPTVATS